MIDRRPPLGLLLALAVLTIAACVKPRDDVLYLCPDAGPPCPSGLCTIDGVCAQADGAVGQPDGSSAPPDASLEPPDASVEPPDASLPDAGPECQQNGECGKCEHCTPDGRCEFQVAGQDVKDECENGLACATGACDGAGACGLKDADEVCRPAADLCDRAEHCTGTSVECPADQLEPSTKVCRDLQGVCDLVETCDGVSAACPTDVKRSATSVCLQESCSNGEHTPAVSCSGGNDCEAPTPFACAPYVCGQSQCLTRCSQDSDCTTGICDLSNGDCALRVSLVDCDADAGALQAAIDGWSDPDRQYLKVAGTCRNVQVLNKEVYLSGGTINPTATGGTAGAAAVHVVAGTDGKAFAGMVGVAVVGSSGRGVLVEGAGSPVGQARAYVHGGVIGSEAAPNSSHGIEANTASVEVSASYVQFNQGSGLYLRDSNFVVQNSVIARNGGPSGGIGVVVSSTTPGLTQAFRHDTVAFNQGGGMSCAGAIDQPTLLQSIFWNPGASEQVLCLVDPSCDVKGAEDACANAAAAPGFVAPDLPNPDYHLDPTSSCIDKLDCAGELPTDIDDQARPQDLSSCDVGADEVL